MKRNNIYFAVAIFIVFMSVSCGRSSSLLSSYMILDEVKYVNKFPQIFSLQNNIDPDLDIIGIKNFVIYDSIMILSTNDETGLWSFFSLSNYNHLGNFLKKGIGPFEFVQPPRVSNEMKLFRENNLLFAYIYDFQKGKMLKMDIDESINTNELHISMLTDSLPPFIFNFVIIDSTKFFCKEVNQTMTQQIRYVYNNSKQEPLPFMQKLNQASIREGEDINILSTITKLNTDNNIIVEMPIGLNYINTYSLDGSFSKTICIGNNLYNIDKIQDQKRWDRIYTYADLRIFSDFWGVVLIDEDEGTYQRKRKKLPSILLFDWQGEPLAELKLNHFITSFDIDFINGNLYTLDVHSDEFYKYDIKDILANLK